MKKQLSFLSLLLALIAPIHGQANPPEGNELSEAEQQMLSAVSANISGLNLGENIRNDIVWRKKWVEQLKETEEAFYKIISVASPPYKLLYSTAIETKNINYQTETADLNISLHLLANVEWFKAVQKSLKVAQAVMDGLNATGRKKDWGLDEWPKQGVSENNPFTKRKEYYFSVKFELVNQDSIVIGRQTAELKSSFKIDSDFFIDFTPKSSSVLTFNKVYADDISDKLIIRLASVDDAFPVTAISTKEPPQNPVKRTTFTDARDNKKYQAVEIGSQTWMAENLNYNANGKCYDNKPANCQKYGRLYNWETAMKACPKGWHLPSEKEWTKLTDFVGGEKTAGKHLKAKSGWNKNGNGLDSYSFSALPGGCRSDGSFDGVGILGFWWSASESNGNGALRYMIYNGEDVGGGNDFKSYLLSVRCLQD